MIPTHRSTAVRFEATIRLSAANTIATPSSASKPSTAQYRHCHMPIAAAAMSAAKISTPTADWPLFSTS